MVNRTRKISVEIEGSECNRNDLCEEKMIVYKDTLDV